MPRVLTPESFGPRKSVIGETVISKTAVHAADWDQKSFVSGDIRSRPAKKIEVVIGDIHLELPAVRLELCSDIVG